MGNVWRPGKTGQELEVGHQITVFLFFAQQNFYADSSYALD